MKKILLLFMICTTIPLIAKIGCYTNDHYSTRNFAHCLCDCDVKSRPTCWKCGHYHEAPGRQIVVKPHSTSTKKNTLTVPLSPEEALQNMINTHKNTH